MLALDAHAVMYLHHAGLLIGNSVYYHKAVKADSHHAERGAWQLFDRGSAGVADVFRQYSGGYGLSLGNSNTAAVDDNGDSLRR